MSSFAHDHVELDGAFTCSNGHGVVGGSTFDISKPYFRRFAIRDGRWIAPEGEAPLTGTIKVQSSCRECPMVWWCGFEVSWSANFRIEVVDSVVVRVERIEEHLNKRPLTPEEQAKSFWGILRREQLEPGV